jgi:uncharacterized secreted protein with C-terminal beta-propeller domain
VDRKVILVIGILAFSIGVIIPFTILPTTPYQKTTVAGTPSSPRLSILIPQTPQLEVYRDLLDKIVRQAILTTYAPSLLNSRGLWASPQLDLIRVASTGSLPIAVVTPETTVSHLLSYSEQPEYSKTNIQVAGVDEQDIVKTNGRVIAIVRDKDIVVVDALNGKVASYIYINNVRGLYLVNNDLIALREEPLFYILGSNELKQSIVYPVLVEVVVYDLEDPLNPIYKYRVNFTGVFAGSRLVGNYLYVIGYMDAYRLWDQGGDRALTPLLPIVNGEPIPRENISETGAYSSYVILLSLDLNSGAYTAKAYLGGGVEWIYMVPDRLYIAWSNPLINYIALVGLLEHLHSKGVISELKLYEYMKMIEEGRVEEVGKDLALTLDKYYNATTFHEEYIPLNYTDETAFLVLDINGLEASQRGVFKVPGRVLDQFAMEEYHVGDERFMVVATTVSKYIAVVYYNKYCRVEPSQVVTVEEVRGEARTTRQVKLNTTQSGLTCEPISWFTGIQSSSTVNNVYIVNNELNIVSNLTELAPGEKVYAARLLKNILYLVTFRQVDPLFAVDLSDPYKPRVLGYLKIPGFSEYLHPLTESKLLGVGRENSALKISLFDISNPINMSEAAKLLLKDYVDSEVFRDHHAILIDHRYKYIAIPVTIAWSWRGFAIIEFDAEGNILKLRELVKLESPMRAVYIDNRLYLVAYSKTITYQLPELRYLGGISY